MVKLRQLLSFSAHVVTFLALAKAARSKTDAPMSVCASV